MDRRDIIKHMAIVGLGAKAAWAAAVDADTPEDGDRGAQIADMQGLGYVVVTPNGPDDGGHFGPRTPGTRTSGIQEALEHAKAVNRDLFIGGGSVSYGLQETLEIPWRQNWRMDGGDYWLSYGGQSGDAVVIDSQMNCRIKLGLVVTAADGAVVRVSPRSKGPDGLQVCVVSHFVLNGFVGSGDVWGREGSVQRGIGLLIEGPVVKSKFEALEANACDVGIYVKAGPNMNWISSPSLQLCNTHLKIGDEEAPRSGGNWYQAGINGGVPGATGVQIFGEGNHLNLSVSGQSPGRDIVFEETAKDNLVVATGLQDGITNKATTPTNRIIASWPTGFSVKTPAVPESGADLTNREPYTVDVFIIDPGEVSQWTLTDPSGGSQTVPAGLSSGQRFTLDPGDRIRFDHTSPPSWRWKALR